VRISKKYSLFFIVGTIGFFVDLSFFMLFFELAHQNPYFSRLGSFLVAVLVTFMLNSRYTFRERKKSRPIVYLISQSLGVGLNMLVFSLFIWYFSWLPFQHYFGLAAGSLVAMFFNYEVSSRYVFR
jgi:putative flippase GtrA